MNKKIRAKKIPAASQPLPPLKLQSTTHQWEGAFPYMQETYLSGDEVVVVGQFIASDDPEFEQFLYQAVRHANLPKWLKSNFAKIKKKIRDEIKHRTKLNEKLSREQKHAIGLFFNDISYFDRDEQAEFFELELEKAAISFLIAILDTKNYDTFVRQGQRRRKMVLSKYGQL